MNAIDVARNDERIRILDPRLGQLVEWLDTDFILEDPSSHRDIDVIISGQNDCFYFVDGDRCPSGVIVGVWLNVKHLVLMEDIEYKVEEVH